MKKKLTAVIIFMVSIMIMTILAYGANKYINMDLKYDGAVHKYNAEEVKLVVDNTQLQNLTMPPIILNGYTLVPAREVFEKLGATVDWKSDIQQVYITYNDDIVLLTIDDKKAYVNGVPKEMSVPAKIINDKTMIPIRFVSEAIGLDVGWDGVARTITINQEKSEQTEITTEAIITEATTTSATTTTKAQVNIEQSGNIDSLVDITPASNPQTNITSVSSSSDGYVISASSAISSVSTLELDEGKRVVVDITNAVNATPKSEYLLTNGKVNTIKTGQFSSSPMVARVVFMLNSAEEYSLKMTSDRKNIVISFGETEIANIDEISLSSTSKADTITISGSNIAPDVSISQSTDGSLLTIDATNSILSSIKGDIEKGVFIIGGSYYAQSSSVVRMSLNLNEKITYTTTKSGKNTVITITESPFKNMTYDSTNHQLTINTNGLNINTNTITHNDNYNDLIYTLTFNGDHSSVFGNGDMQIGDGYLSSINFSTTNGKSVITLKESKILAYDVTSDNTNLYIKAVLPKDKYKNIVVLDAGHGGSDPGASGNGLVEKDLTLDMLNRVVSLCNAGGNIKAYATRTTDVYPSFDDRTGLANEVGDVFISIHINSTTSASPSGTETYHLYPNTQQNGLTSYTVASKMLEKLLAQLGTIDRKVKSSNLKVLRDSVIPASLIEIGFITNPSDAAIMGSEQGKQKTAQAVYDALVDIFNEYPTGR